MSPEFYALRSFRSSSPVFYNSDLNGTTPLILPKNSTNDESTRCDCKIYVKAFGVIALGALAVTLGVLYGLQTEENTIGVGAIVSSGTTCATHGGEILREGGSAIDAAIVTLLCDGIMLPHSLGIGGGFVATVYTKETGNVEALIARETAPSAATSDMYVGKTQITGGISAAVPGEIYGYWELHQKYGKLPWKRLFKHAIAMCKNGHIVSKHLGNAIAYYEELILHEPTMAEIFINPNTKEIFKEGERMYRPKLAETLEIIAEEGINCLYRGGSLGKALVEDIQELGGIITESDLENFDVSWEEPIISHLTGDHKVYTTPLPTSGVLLAYILNVMDPLYTNDEDVYWQRLIETFKHAYGHRTLLGDIHFEPSCSKICENLLSNDFAEKTRELIEDDRTFYDFKHYGADFSNAEDHGTANIIVLSPNGDAIVLTSTINSHFGAKVVSRRTGIILNDEMDDFSTPGITNVYGIPASPVNYIKPGKRPMSSMCPCMIFDKYGNLEMMIGGAGGSRITTAIAQVILRYMVLNESITDALTAGRIHHQLAPMRVDMEISVPERTAAYLSKVGHEVNYLQLGKAHSALNAIGLKESHAQTKPEPSSDVRRPGSIVVIEP